MEIARDKYLEELRDKNSVMAYERNVASAIRERINEPRRFIQIVIGLRQTGKTTAVAQALVTGTDSAASAEHAPTSGPSGERVQREQRALLVAAESGSLTTDNGGRGYIALGEVGLDFRANGVSPRVRKRSRCRSITA